MDNAKLDINNGNEIGDIHENNNNMDNFPNISNSDNNYRIDVDFAINLDKKIFKNNFDVDFDLYIHFKEFEKNNYEKLILVLSNNSFFQIKIF